MSIADSATLKGRHVVITGGARGIGAACAEAFAGQGACVSLIGRTEASLQETRKRLGLSGGIACADVADDNAIDAAMACLRTEHGPVEILVNNAGAAESAPFKATARDLWDRMIAVNLTGTFNVTRAALPDLLKAPAGRIINIASTASLKGYAYVSAYCAAKHGVLGLTRSLALELAHTAVTVNAICPGFTDTDLLANSIGKISDASGMSADEARKQLVSVNPQGRFVEPDEVAQMAVWLCSDAARSVTGQALAIAGGEVM